MSNGAVVVEGAAFTTDGSVTAGLVVVVGISVVDVSGVEIIGGSVTSLVVVFVAGIVELSLDSVVGAFATLDG